MFGLERHVLFGVDAWVWLTRWRRLAREHEKRIDVSEAMTHVAMGSLLLRRISH